jgi:hypothetical protein
MTVWTIESTGEYFGAQGPAIRERNCIESGRVSRLPRAMRASEIHCARHASGDSFAMSVTWGGFMEAGVERRAARRFSMMLPVKVRFEAGNGVSEEQGETRDVSFRGLYFLIKASVETGSSIEFVLTLPQQITLAGDVHIRCYARVLRVEPHDGRRGIAARIERYEFLPAAA